MRPVEFSRLPPSAMPAIIQASERGRTSGEAGVNLSILPRIMVATRFSVALHILLFIACDTGGDATSARMAESIGTNPVVVRRIGGLLARAGLIVVQRGPGGATLARPANAISMRDVWRAVHAGDERLIKVHPRSGARDQLARLVPDVLATRFEQAEVAMLAELDRSSIADLARRMRPERGVAAGGRVGT